MKNYIALFLISIAFVACRQSNSESNTIETAYSQIIGETMGTYYRVVYNSAENYQISIDSLLIDINQQVNTYDPKSLISQFNQGTELVIEANEPQHFSQNLEMAHQIYEKTDGFFDPTVMPLVYYWGFGKNKKAVEEVDSKKIETLLSYIGLDKIETSRLKSGGVFYEKSNPSAQLDFSAIAKGYAVDMVGQLFMDHDISNYLVEIGGETVTKGVNSTGNSWTIGIIEPTKQANPQQNHNALVQIGDRAMATSGDYLNFYEVNGKRYGHTLNPKTGYSAMSNILSASVVADKCMMADGFATGFMAMGIEKAFEMANSIPELEAFFIYDDNGETKVKYTEGMKALIVE